MHYLIPPPVCRILTIISEILQKNALHRSILESESAIDYGKKTPTSAP